MKKNKIFIACDTVKIKKVRNIIRNAQTSKIKFGYKFGLEFINSKNGRKFLSKLKKKIIFLDLKLNDIPNTCLSTIKAVKDLKANYITIHVSSGLNALKAVKKNAGNTKIVGVTTLTSLNDGISLKEIGYDKKLKSLVVHQAKLASKAKLDALVCSAQEVRLVKKVFKKEIITPGIRFNSKLNDQKRVMTPIKAFKNGSDWLVIGRPITKGNIKKNIQNLINHLNND
jgi:orotidine 5''-phosphate decarboxylase, subfamily 1